MDPTNLIEKIALGMGGGADGKVGLDLTREAINKMVRGGLRIDDRPRSIDTRAMNNGITRNEFQAELRAMRSDMEKSQAELRADFATMQRGLIDAISKVAEGNAETRAQFAELRGEVRAELGNLRGEMGELRGDVRSEIGSLKSDIGELRGELSGVKHVTNWTLIIVGLFIAAGSLGIGLAQVFR